MSLNQLFKHQEDFLSQKINKTTLVWSCGTGKTRAALEWAKRGVDPALIIVPKALKANWLREASAGSVQCYILTKEEFRRDAAKLHAFKQVIVDEVHNGFLTPLFKSQMSKALRSYLKRHKVPRVLLLSATVYTSSPWNIFNLAHYTGHEWNYRTFNDTFFSQVRMGFRMIPVVKKGSEAKLARLTKQIANVVDIHDVLDVPLQYHAEPETFALTKEQERAIEDNYDPLPIVRYTAQHEIENGILIGNEFIKNQVYPCDKIDRLIELCKENRKIAVVCRYNYQIDELYKILRGLKDTLVIRGDVKDRDQVTRLAEHASDVIVLIQADCAEGYQLPSFELCVFASQSYSYTKWEQICGRFLRMDKPSRTTFLYLLTEGDSIDKAVYDAIRRKEDFKIELYKSETRSKLPNHV